MVSCGLITESQPFWALYDGLDGVILLLKVCQSSVEYKIREAW